MLYRGIWAAADGESGSKEGLVGRKGYASRPIYF